MNEKPNLRPLWDAILEVYKVFADICERHGLRYCADCGTALGAIRHGGFIPWDDDMDLQMPRPDYEKFVKIAKRELPDGYAWVDKSNSEEINIAFGKVVVTDKEMIEKVSRESRRNLFEGIFIDVFPLDGFPDTRLGRFWRKVQNALVAFSSDAHGSIKNCRTWKSKVGYLIGLVLWPINYKMRNARDVAEFYERRAKKLPFGSTDMCVSIGISRHDDDKPYPFRFFGTPRFAPFEGVKMPVQENVDGYLRYIFGDYMKLPPPEMRRGTHSRPFE